MTKIREIVVLGDGGWGTTLAILLKHKGFSVTLWSAFDKQARMLAARRENVPFLKGVKIPGDIRITTDMRCLTDADVIVAAVPSQYLRPVLVKGKKFYSSACPVVSVIKGVEPRRLLRMSQVIGEVWQTRRLAVLSGPTIAQEVAHGIPTTAVAASADSELMFGVQDMFMTSSFRIYANPDVVGVELGGSLKNIIAIACGISDGLGFGTNTKAAILSRGLAEMSRLGQVMGAKRETFFGIAGVGDLVTTCFNELSRNHYVGLKIGRGAGVKNVLAGMKMVAEGVLTSKAAWLLGRKHGVELPITSEIYKVLFRNKPPRLAVEHLMMRARKTE